MADEAIGHNLPKPADINSALKQIEALNSDMEVSKSKHMATCKECRASQKDVYKAAKAAGVDIQALKAKVKKRQLQAKIDKVVHGLEGDQFIMFEHIEEVVDGQKLQAVA